MSDRASLKVISLKDLRARATALALDYTKCTERREVEDLIIDEIRKRERDAGISESNMRNVDGANGDGVGMKYKRRTGDKPKPKVRNFGPSFGGKPPPPNIGDKPPDNNNNDKMKNPFLSPPSKGDAPPPSNDLPPPSPDKKSTTGKSHNAFPSSFDEEGASTITKPTSSHKELKINTSAFIKYL